MSFENEVCQRILPVVDRLYAAAAREITLDDAFVSVGSSFGDFVAALFVHDPVMGDTTLDACVGIDRGWVEDYNRRWGSCNPLVSRSLSDLMAGKIMNSDHVMPWEELSVSDYGREFFGAIGARYSLSALVAGHGQKHASYVSARAASAGPYESIHYAMLEGLRVHMGRALHILEYFEGARLSLALFRQSMDALPFSVMLADDARSIVYANAQAEAQLACGEVFAVEGRRKLSARGRARDGFVGAWRQLAADELSDGTSVRLSTGFETSFRCDITRIRIAGSAPGARRLWMVRAYDYTQTAATSPNEWRARFGFTAAESRVGTALLRGLDTSRAAQELGVSVNTVRTHLKRMFAKTGTHTQTSLVLRIALQLDI